MAIVFATAAILFRSPEAKAQVLASSEAEFESSFKALGYKRQPPLQRGNERIQNFAHPNGVRWLSLHGPEGAPYYAGIAVPWIQQAAALDLVIFLTTVCKNNACDKPSVSRWLETHTSPGTTSNQRFGELDFELTTTGPLILISADTRPKHFEVLREKEAQEKRDEEQRELEAAERARQAAEQATQDAARAKLEVAIAALPSGASSDQVTVLENQIEQTSLRPEARTLLMRKLGGRMATARLAEAKKGLSTNALNNAEIAITQAVVAAENSESPETYLPEIKAVQSHIAMMRGRQYEEHGNLIEARIAYEHALQAGNNAGRIGLQRIESRKKNASTAGLLSTLIPGAGQVYSGHYGAAAGFFIATSGGVLGGALALADANSNYQKYKSATDREDIISRYDATKTAASISAVAFTLAGVAYIWNIVNSQASAKEWNLEHLQTE